MNPLSLTHIERLCTQRGVRLTAQRKQVFLLICQAQKSSSAYELLEALQKIQPQAKPPTIYRALDFLIEQGFVHRIESTNTYIACHFSHSDKHYSQLLVCTQCANVTELQDDAVITLLTKNAQQRGFHLSHHVIESHGICSSCFLALKHSD